MGSRLKWTSPNHFMSVRPSHWYSDHRKDFRQGTTTKAVYRATDGPRKSRRDGHRIRRLDSFSLRATRSNRIRRHPMTREYPTAPTMRAIRITGSRCLTRRLTWCLY